MFYLCCNVIVDLMVLEIGFCDMLLVSVSCIMLSELLHCYIWGII